MFKRRKIQYYDDEVEKIQTHDLIPYIYDKYGYPICEEESYTVKWVDKGLDINDNYIGSRLGKSVFDQMSDETFEILMLRIEIRNEEIKRRKKIIKINNIYKLNNIYKKQNNILYNEWN